MNDFAEYIFRFYGKHGLLELRNKAGTALSRRAIKSLLPAMYAKMEADKWDWGGGDSADREFFRTQVLAPAGYHEAE